MLTYSFENRGSDSLYESLYKQIKADILSYRLSPREKLPSKRALAKHLNISTVTVESAYSQLQAEGFIYSVPKSGFFVSPISDSLRGAPEFHTASVPKPGSEIFADFAGNSTPGDSFPFPVWGRLLRRTMSDYPEKLMVRSPSAGVDELRSAIAEHLYRFRGMKVSPDCIVVGAGTEYLYALLIQLLGRDRLYAVEDPGYGKISRIYSANGVNCIHIPLDDKGVLPSALASSGAQVLHISPSHHFPTGIVTPISRRYELLSWVCSGAERYIIEDDYDSELRLLGKPIPALQSIDMASRVIYMNTFTKSLSGTIRISYMVLPEPLMEKYRRELSFYACTVSNFEQYTLAAFIRDGHLERHLGRMRKRCREKRDLLISCIKAQERFALTRILEEDSGLHFLLEVNSPLTDAQLIANAEKNQIRISCLGEYYHRSSGDSRTLLINYSALDPEKIPEAVQRLFDSLWP